ncbi:glycerophosphodiester phosphodiesterase [Actinobacteria bacterium YIM 96077]|uniref:Glycerophosphodiester phosphodiesterase n=1 Tax=Phytoactinopolyspora halophila TaxID=1981511 RepID=A0A329QZZ9_9ACTN|nr:glycerophosphodiester phosphodiesterase [Phytoactinopolyspora halophila]AYY15465.1 glycerophosphodiester phosphodiesterase [Actinobacteria bacterium YIM 96077]RAW17476.1 glycerophosphodiester phosphodiesterase [Phytoactinopolyspora halophila]
MRPQPPHPYFDHPGPLALAHRGFSREGLENSMRAFAAAVDAGYRYVETDVHATSDGVVVAFHDATLDRVTDRRGEIARMPWSQVRRARIGGVEPVPTLEDVLGTWPELRVNIDVKAASAVGPTVRAIERTGAHGRVCIASFSDSRRRAVLRGLSRKVATSAGRSIVSGFVFASRVGLAARMRAWLAEIHCLQVPVRMGSVQLVTQKTVADAHAAGRQVHVWTVNHAPEMHRLLDLGVDGILTDRADILRDVLRTRGSWST